MAVARRASPAYLRAWNTAQVPAYPVELDRSNAPRGLVISVLPGLSSVDLVTGLQPTTTGSPLKVASPAGLAMSPNSGYHAYPAAPPPLFSMEALVVTGTGSPTGCIATWNDGATAGGTFDRSIEIFSGWEAYIFSGGAQRVNNPTAVTASTVTHIVGVYDGTNLHCYINGADGTPLAAGAPFSGYGVTPCVLLGQSLGTGGWTGSIALFNYANLAWTAAEVAQRAAAPFAMFRPVVRRFYGPIAAAAGPTVTADMWNQAPVQPYRGKTEMVPY